MWLSIATFIILATSVNLTPHCEDFEFQVPTDTSCIPLDTFHLFQLSANEKSQPYTLLKGSVEVFLIFNASNINVWLGDEECPLLDCNISPFENTRQLLFARILSQDVDVAVQSTEDQIVEMRIRVDGCFAYECLDCNSFSGCQDSEVSICNGGETVLCDDNSESAQSGVPVGVYIALIVVVGLCICFLIHCLIMRSLPPKMQDAEDPKLISDDDNSAKEGIWNPVDTVNCDTAKKENAAGGNTYDFDHEEEGEKSDEKQESVVEMQTVNETNNEGGDQTAAETIQTEEGTPENIEEESKTEPLKQEPKGRKYSRDYSPITAQSDEDIAPPPGTTVRMRPKSRSLSRISDGAFDEMVDSLDFD